jgi:EF hand
MKKLFWIFSISLLTSHLPAQSNAPVQLALIAETDEASAASDILTAQLSGNQKIHLLERDEIGKIYHEQGMSAANRDDLKLGRILGADGLLLLDVVRTPQATNLTARLIAVKPGVILTDGSFPWPLKDTAQWAESVSTYLNSFLPKLSLLVKDAVPISVVNLRSAISSSEAGETERQLKLLTIQRLSREPQFFVLERQKMQLLGEEKELKTDDSAFWNGSYLLEGVVDQNGYSKETVTINARLTPPKGGAPLLFEVSGNRTNLSETVNQLAVKITNALKINSVVKEWNAADEAEQYFNEAKWALRWGIFLEAQAAADSAWALGKQDLACGMVRVQSYVSELKAETGGIQIGQSGISSHYVTNGMQLPVTPDDSQVQSMIKYLLATHPFGMVYKIAKRPGDTDINFAFADKPPDPKDIDHAFHALELYYKFSRIAPDGEPKILSRGKGWNDWHNSDWYQLGIDDLVAASRVLQNFNFIPESQKPVADQLAELRALARSVAKLISKSPTVHDSYFVGDRIVTHDELGNTIGENPSIYRCEVNWGCYWQETPEDTIALYRELMSSPVFCYLHQDLWFRPLQRPRLVAWTENDRARIAAVWNDFLREMDASTNVFMRMEGKAIKLRDANDEKETAVAATNFFEALLENRCAFITNNVEVLYLNWGVDDLVEAMGGYKDESSGAIMRSATPEWEAIRAISSAYATQIKAKDDACHKILADNQKILADQQNLPAFEKQKQYLKDKKPFDFQEFSQLFLIGFNDYSKAEALEIQPFIAAYKSNLVAQSQNASAMQKGKLMEASFEIGNLESDVNRILNPSAPQPATARNNNLPAPVARPQGVPKIPEATPETVSNILLVKHHLATPEAQIKSDEPEDKISDVGYSIRGSYEGRPWFDLRYKEEYIVWLPAEGGSRWESFAHSAVAFLNPQNETWELLPFPEPKSPAYLATAEFSEFFSGALYVSGASYLRRYDLKTRQWETLNVPWQQPMRLVTVMQRMFAIHDAAIFEILDGGHNIKILASTRRRPAVSVLDSLDTLGSPQLFSGLDHSLCASIGNKIYSWNRNDWHEVFTLNISQAPEIFDDAVVFRSIPSSAYDNPSSLWTWKEDQAAPELCVYDKAKPRQPGDYGNVTEPYDQTLHPLWRSPDGDYLASATATYFKSNLFFFVDHCIVTNIDGHWTVAVKDGYHARLVCLSRDLPNPIIVPLKFDLQQGQPPLKSLGEKFESAPWLAGSTWMSFVGETLYIGQPNFMGIWTIPASEIEAAVAVQKQIQLAQQAREFAAAEQSRKSLLLKYDLNHNGIIDPDEKEEALDDPAFIESELDAIDANHNGWLDAEELTYFDANKNKTLETKEQAGIDIALHLLALKLLKKFDVDGDGFIDRSEFNDLWHSHQKTMLQPCKSPFRTIYFRIKIRMSWLIWENWKPSSSSKREEAFVRAECRGQTLSAR